MKRIRLIGKAQAEVLTALATGNLIERIDLARMVLPEHTVSYAYSVFDSLERRGCVRILLPTPGRLSAVEITDVGRAELARYRERHEQRPRHRDEADRFVDGETDDATAALAALLQR